MTAAKIGAGAVNGEKVADGSLTGSDVNAATLGKVPTAASADHASTAGTATSAASAGTATTATSAAKADNAADAEKLGGSNPSAFGAVLTSLAPLASVEDLYVPVTGVGPSSTESRATMTLPNQKLVATDFAVRLTGPASATEFISVFLLIDGNATPICTLEKVPDLCTPSLTIPLNPASEVSWHLGSSLGPAEFQAELALRLIRG